MLGQISDIGTAVVSLVAIVGIVLTVRSIREQTRTRKFALAQIYVERFWAIDDALRDAERGRRRNLDMQRGRYVRLCEDEYELARLDIIDVEIWAVWHDSIVENVSILLPLLRRPRESPSDTFDLLNLCLAAGPHLATACPAVPPRSRRAAR